MNAPDGVVKKAKKEKKEARHEFFNRGTFVWSEANERWDYELPDQPVCAPLDMVVHADAAARAHLRQFHSEFERTCKNWVKTTYPTYFDVLSQLRRYRSTTKNATGDLSWSPELFRLWLDDLVRWMACSYWNQLYDFTRNSMPCSDKTVDLGKRDKKADDAAFAVKKVFLELLA